MRVIAARDEAILLLFNARDEQALQETQKQYGALCRSVAQNILGNAEDAEECFNDMLLQAWNSIPPAAPKNLAAFLLKIIRNNALMRWRRQNAQKRGGQAAAVSLSELEEILPAAGSVESEAERRELLQAVTRFLQGIPERQRLLFLGRYFRFADIPALAEETGLSETAVQAALSRIRKNLKQHLRKEGFL